MKHYFIANIKLTDEREYRKYLDRCDEVFAKFNGKYLAVDKNPRVLEGTWDYSRAVIIEFPSEEEFLKWYYSDEYREIIEYRLKGAGCDTILVRGK